MKNVTLFILVLMIINGQAQTQRSYETNPDRKRTFNWLFGDSIWLDYRTNPPIQKNGSHLKALESSTVLSDTGGNLLLYSDGVTVWNKNHKIIKNGTGLNGNESSSQGSLFIPQPNNDSIVYLFTTDWQGKSKGFCYNKIILNKNGDSSTVVEKNIKLLPSVFESISATKHANGIWTWVVVRNASGKGINAFLITDKGLINCGIYSESQANVVYDDIGSQSISTFSNDGSNYIISFVIGLDYFEILNFDNLRGQFTSKSISGIVTPTAITFTKDNKYCYLAERDFNLYRIDCKDWNKVAVNNHNDSFMFVGSRMNPYNQIEFNIFDSMFMGRVVNSEQANPKFIRKGLKLNKKATNGLPNFDNSYNNTLGVNFIYKINCSTHQVEFNGQDTFNANNYLWKIKKVFGGSWQNIGTTKKLIYSFTDTGLYTAQFIASNGSIKDTTTKQIVIGDKIPKSILGRDTGYCKGSFPTLTLKAPQGLHCIYWNTDSTSQSITINQAGRYIATITTASLCQISDTVNLYEDTILLKPQIIRHGDSLLSSIKATKYTWKRDNIVISHSPSIRLNKTGIYQLEISGNGGCQSKSDTLSISKLSVATLSVQTIDIYPNPVTENLIIEGLNPDTIYNLYILDNTGKTSLTLLGVIHTVKLTIPVTNLSNGIYTIQIKDNNYKQTIKKFIKQ